jgi:UDP-N-acetylglucosamine--N-acetylmuramyl-(pentapeptide) pyrophosphoryl-undecaprenol N-acetylglucosamine transferase
MSAKAIIISGGGTGGHIYPALAVGRKLRERDPAVALTFVGTGRDVERKIIEQSGLGFIPLRIEGLKGKGLKAVKSLFLLPFSFFKSLAILRRLKPRLVIGTGSYSSGPIVLLASLKKIPTLILEQNVHPSLTNRLLRRWVRKAVVAFEATLPAFQGKGLLLGNPVREDFYGLKPKERERKLTLLIFGGSQGSRFLNRAVTSTLPLLREEKERLVIIHQTGTEDAAWVRKCYDESGFGNATVAPYFHNMADCFGKADLIICRAGATTIAELMAGRKAAVLFPFAGATENHQTWNAQELERIGAADIVLETEFSPELLARKIRHFLNNIDEITAREKKLAAWSLSRPAEKIADLCFELMGED